MDTLLQDLRYAARTLVKNPGFAALTIACLALGIGVNSTIFSVVDTVAIRPLPFLEPDRLVSLATTHQANGVDYGAVSLAGPAGIMVECQGSRRSCSISTG